MYTIQPTCSLVNSTPCWTQYKHFRFYAQFILLVEIKFSKGISWGQQNSSSLALALPLVSMLDKSCQQQSSIRPEFLGRGWYRDLSPSVPTLWSLTANEHIVDSQSTPKKLKNDFGKIHSKYPLARICVIVCLNGIEVQSWNQIWNIGDTVDTGIGFWGSDVGSARSKCMHDVVCLLAGFVPSPYMYMYVPAGPFCWKFYEVHFRGIVLYVHLSVYMHYSQDHAYTCYGVPEMRTPSKLEHVLLHSIYMHKYRIFHCTALLFLSLPLSCTFWQTPFVVVVRLG